MQSIELVLQGLTYNYLHTTGREVKKRNVITLCDHFMRSSKNWIKCDILIILLENFYNKQLSFFNVQVVTWNQFYTTTTLALL